ncbi:MAG: hypothetical protein IK044_04380 [Methanobrevibacter sp.]|nr:hypothetical protein [Methanobrevibacter sp.]
MATPIAPTPLLEGESAEQLEKYMKRPMTKKEKEIRERARKTRDVPMFKIE